MASNSNPLDPTGRSIITQVALKEAAAGERAGIGDFGELFRKYTDTLMFEVYNQKEAFFDEVAAAKAATPTAPAGGGTTTEAAIIASVSSESTIASADAASNGTIKVLGQQHGPLPEWFITAATHAGVTRVFDNRDRIAGTNKPHFVTPKDAEKNGEPNDKAFWPPR